MPTTGAAKPAAPPNAAMPYAAPVEAMSPRLTSRITGRLVLVRAPDDGRQRLPAGRAVLLEERGLGLDAGGHAGYGVDDAAAELLEAGGDGDGVAQFGRLRPVLLDQLGRHALEHGIEPDADDAATRTDGRGQSVGEMLHEVPPVAVPAHGIARSPAQTPAGHGVSDPRPRARSRRRSGAWP